MKMIMLGRPILCSFDVVQHNDGLKSVGLIRISSKMLFHVERGWSLWRKH